MSNPIISQFFRVYNGVYDITKSRTAKFDFSVIFVQLFSFWDEILIIVFLHCSKILAISRGRHKIRPDLLLPEIKDQKE